MAESAWLIFHCETDKQTRIATFRHTGKEWQLAEVSADTVPEGGAIPGRITMNGRFGVARSYAGCPGCGAASYVHCGGCRELGCWRPGAKYYTCANCGNRSRVAGRLSSADAMDVA